MELTNKKNILIVGLGLMGGSYAKALGKKGYRVSAITRSSATIRYALEQGIIAEGTTRIDPVLIGKADIVIFALYPKLLVTLRTCFRAASQLLVGCTIFINNAGHFFFTHFIILLMHRFR